MSERFASEVPHHSECSLAQKLYEASPASGWSGPWHRLPEGQRRWWEEFAALARTYVNLENQGHPRPAHIGSSRSSHTRPTTIQGPNG